MTEAVQRIKTKVLSLPALTLPTGQGSLIIETDASSTSWGGVLIEKVDNLEEVCAYASGSFRGAELNYPSSHKEILAVKKVVQHFRLYLKPVKFVIRTDLKIMPGIFKNENLMAENNARILKWFVWLQNFDFELVYKPGYLNCLADMLSRECTDLVPSLGMFAGDSSRRKKKRPEIFQKIFGEEDESERIARRLWCTELSPQKRSEEMQKASPAKVARCQELMLFEAIKESPLKLTILEKWEKKAFRGYYTAINQLHHNPKHRQTIDWHNEEYYIGVDSGIMYFDTYQLILQAARELGSVIINVDASNLAGVDYSGWLKVLLNNFCPREDWTDRGDDFIQGLDADFWVAHQNHLWFKFKLIHTGSSFTHIDNPSYIPLEREYISADGKTMGWVTELIELNTQVISHFKSEYICEPLECMQMSPCQKCFCHYLYPVDDAPSFDSDDNKSLDSEGNVRDPSLPDEDSDRPDWCQCGQPECVCIAGRFD